MKIRDMEAADVPTMSAAFEAIGWNKPAAQFARYFAEQEAGARRTLVAVVGGAFAGYVNVVWLPDYLPLRDAGLPEMQDFNVLPQFRRQGVGTRLMDAAEALAAEQSEAVGIGVGLYDGYGPAQCLYIQRGYLPDGLGLSYQHRTLNYGEQVTLDDDLVLHFIKHLTGRDDQGKRPR